MTELQNAQVVPLVRVAVYGEEDFQVSWGELDEYNRFDPATISDDEMISLVAEHMDTTPQGLNELVYGNNDGGNLKVSRPETGNIVIRPETRLG